MCCARSRVELAACKDTSTSSNRFSLRYSSSPLSCGRGHASDVWLKAFNIARSRSWASLSSGRYLFAPCVCVTRSAGIRRQISIVPHRRELEDQSLSLREARPCTFPGFQPDLRTRGVSKAVDVGTSERSSPWRSRRRRNRCRGTASRVPRPRPPQRSSWRLLLVWRTSRSSWRQVKLFVLLVLRTRFAAALRP